MKNPFSFSQAQQPFLSPLGRQRRLPVLAAPVLLTLFGGVALVVAFGTLFGLQPSGIPSLTAGPEVAGAQAEAPRPRIVTVERAREIPGEEEPALVTALPHSPVAETGEVVLEPVPELETAELDADGDADSDRTAAIALPAEITAFAPQPRPATPPASPAAPAAATASMRAAVVRRAVNMRASPNGGAQVVGVVPGSSEIRAETNCGWCRIDYQGRSGFIYKSFIDYR